MDPMNTDALTLAKLDQVDQVDRADWEDLFRRYLAFYQREIAPEMYDRAWTAFWSAERGPPSRYLT